MDFTIYALKGSSEWFDILPSLQSGEGRFGWSYIESADLRELKKRVDEKGWDSLTEEEKDCLNIVKGTLTAQELEVMHSHVEITEKILSKVHFNRYFANSPVYAVQHHERLDGKGYPKGLKAEDLSVESRIIAVADICDALLELSHLC